MLPRFCFVCLSFDIYPELYVYSLFNKNLNSEFNVKAVDKYEGDFCLIESWEEPPGSRPKWPLASLANYTQHL